MAKRALERRVKDLENSLEASRKEQETSRRELEDARKRAAASSGSRSRGAWMSLKSDEKAPGRAIRARTPLRVGRRQNARSLPSLAARAVRCVVARFACVVRRGASC